MRTMELKKNYEVIIKIVKANVKLIGSDVNKYLTNLLNNNVNYWSMVEDEDLTQEQEERELEAIIDEEVRGNLLYDITVQLANILDYGCEWLDDLLTDEYRTVLYKCYDKISVCIANR